MIRWILAISILFGISNASWAQKNSHAFIVVLDRGKIKVSSPKGYNPFVNIIIENKSMVRVLGILKWEGKKHQFVVIRPGKNKSIELSLKKGDKISFTPISPSFQKINLTLGSKYYEIPSKR